MSSIHVALSLTNHSDTIAQDLLPALFPRHGNLMADLKDGNVELITEAECTAIDGSAVVYVKDGRENRIGGVDSVVLATGMEAYDPLSAGLKAKGIECHVIGDAVKPGFLVDAIHPAAALAREI